MKTWLLTWGLRKMSNFSVNGSSVGKYHKESLNWAQTSSFLRSSSTTALFHSKVLVRVSSLDEHSCLMSVSPLSQQILTVPSGRSFRTKVLTLPAAKFDDCSQLGPSRPAMLLAERTSQIQCLVGALVLRRAPLCLNLGTSERLSALDHPLWAYTGTAPLLNLCPVWLLTPSQVKL